MLIFLVGSLLGVLMGGALCVRYLRREVAADIGPKLKHMQLQLDNIETELVMGDDDLDLLHVGHYRGMTTDVATGLSRATAPLTASRCPGGLARDAGR